MRPSRILLSIGLALLAAIPTLAQEEPRRVLSCDVYFNPVERTHRIEPYLNVVLLKDSAFLNKFPFHLVIHQPYVIRSIELLEHTYLNESTSVSAPSPNPILHGVVYLTTTSGEVKKLFFDSKMTCYYDGHWFKSRKLTKELFKYLAAEARP